MDKELMVDKMNLLSKVFDEAWQKSINCNYKKLKEMWNEELLISRKRRLNKESVHINRLRELGV